MPLSHPGHQGIRHHPFLDHYHHPSPRLGRDDRSLPRHARDGQEVWEMASRVISRISPVDSSLVCVFVTSLRELYVHDGVVLYIVISYQLECKIMRLSSLSP